MNTETAHALCDITSAFYRAHAASFSSTRRGAWAGWENCLDAAGFPPGAPCARVLDVACGNMRFLHFLEERFPSVAFDYLAVDNCEPLAEGEALPFRSRVAFRPIDVAGALLSGELERELAVACAGAPERDASVCFGFFHHVPTVQAREALLRALVRSVRPGGAVAVSFWQFENSPDLARRARETTARACGELGIRDLDRGDYLVGWQNEPHAYRYCHSFASPEIDKLAASAQTEADVVSRFTADGRTGNLNAYLVLRRKG